MKDKKTEKPKANKEVKPKKGELEKLHSQIEDLQKEKAEVFEKLQRISADYANFQKRTPKQIADTVTYEKERIIKTLLPVLDSFDHTLQNADSVENAEAFVKGVQIIHDQMLDILKSFNVEQIKAVDEKFYPAFHQAMRQRAEADREENIVLEEFQKGYKLNDRVIRPSRVIVNKLQSDENQEPKETETKETE